MHGQLHVKNTQRYHSKKANVTEVKTQTIDDFEFGTFEYAGLTRDYALYVPENATGPVPLVIWNHGGGEYRMDIHASMVANRGLTAWPEAGYETAVLMFQISNSNYSYRPNDSKKQLIDQNNALQAAFVRQLISEGKVDENRVYVTGASSGGGATMRFIMQFPEMFAGAIPMCSMDPIVNIHQGASGTYDDIVKQLETAFQGQVWTWDEETSAMVKKDINTQALVDLPIHFTHAQNDPTCKVDSSKAYYEALANLGSTNDKLTIWSDAEMAEYGITNGFNYALLHWSWVRVFNDTAADAPMAWLFNQTNVTNLVTELEEAVAVLEETYTLESKESLEAIVEAVEATKELEATEAQIERLDAVVEVAEAIIESIEKVEGIIADVASIPETFSPDDKEVNATVEALIATIEELTDYEADLVDEDTINTLEEILEKLTAYEVVNVGKWGKGDKGTLTVKVNALFSKFLNVYVDNVLVDPAKYTAKEGSTIIDLKASYLETLTVGTHEMKVEFIDGEVTTTFEVAGEPVQTNTGDYANVALYGALVALSLVALLAISKKRQLSK